MERTKKAIPLSDGFFITGAEREGFEPSIAFRLYQFSRLVVSTTHATSPEVEEIKIDRVNKILNSIG